MYTRLVLKNITLSANPSLIEKARKKAASQKKALNSLFREWLRQYVDETSSTADYDKLMSSFKYASPGRKFSRDEMHER